MDRTPKKTYEPQGFVENCNSKYQNKSVFIYKEISVLSISFNENMCNLIVKKNIKHKKNIKYLRKYLIRFR